MIKLLIVLVLGAIGVALFAGEHQYPKCKDGSNQKLFVTCANGGQ